MNRRRDAQEELNRLRKAILLADAVDSLSRQSGLPIDMLLVAVEDSELPLRHAIEQSTEAGKRSEKTWALVAELLRKRYGIESRSLRVLQGGAA